MVTRSAVSGRAASAELVRYLVCWLLLVLLTALTFALSTVQMGRWSLVLSLLIAFTKASIVALFFMHLWDHEGASRLVPLTAVVFVGILATLVVADVMTRFPAALPPR